MAPQSSKIGSEVSAISGEGCSVACLLCLERIKHTHGVAADVGRMQKRHQCSLQEKPDGETNAAKTRSQCRET